MTEKGLRGTFRESLQGAWLEKLPFNRVPPDGSFNRIIFGLSRLDFSPKGQGTAGCLLTIVAACAVLGLLETIAQKAGVNFGLATATLEATRVLASATPMPHALATATPEALATATGVAEHGMSTFRPVGIGIGVVLLMSGLSVLFYFGNALLSGMLKNLKSK